MKNLKLFKNFLVVVIIFLFLGFSIDIFPKSLYVLNMNGYMEAFDIQGNALIHQTKTSITNGNNAVGLALDEDSQYLFVSYEFANYINTFNANTMEYITQVLPPSASNLAGIVIDQRTHRLYAVNRRQNKLFVYFWDGSAKTLTNLITSDPKYLTLENTVGGPISTSDVSDPGTYGLAIDEANNRLYVGAHSNGVMVYNIDHLTDAYIGGVTAISNIATTPTHNAVDVAIDVDNQFMYCTSASPYGQDILYKYDMGNGNARTSVDVGSDCIGVAVDNASGLVYVTRYNNSPGPGNLQVYNSSLVHQNTYLSGQRLTGLVIPTSGSVSYNPLNLTITAPSVVGQGADINYSISYSNPNASAVTNVTLTAWVPANTTYVSCSTGGVYSAGSGTVTWDIGTIAGSAPVASKSLIVTAPSSPGETISMTARITSPDTGWTQITQEATTQTASGNAPSISGLSGSITYTAGGSSVAIDNGRDAVVTDTDNAHFNGGFLLLDYITSFIDTDQLTVADFGNITRVGDEIRYNGNAIGDVDAVNNGENGNNLKINFDSNFATLEAVGALIHAIEFSNNTIPFSSTPMSQRSMDITVTDPDDNCSPASMVTINVNTASAPTALDATNIGQTSFTANWQAPSIGADSYRLDVSEAIDFSSYVTGYQDKTVSGLSDNVTGLSNPTTYYYRVRAVKSSVTSGNSNTITTTTVSIFIPTITTTAASSITSTTAISGGNVTSDGGAGVTARGVCWSTSINPTIADSHTSDGTGTGSFTSSITGLDHTTTYHIRAYATNSAGTSYGNERSFTTATVGLATVTTNAVSGITSTGASSGGNVTSNGGVKVTARGVCWSTSANPTTADSHTTDGTGTGIFTSNIAGLSPGITYYIRAYATNSAGTAYGNTQTFTTLNIFPTIVITNPIDGATVNGIVIITADSSVVANPVEFYIDDNFLGNGVLSTANNNNGFSFVSTVFNIDDSKYLFIDGNNQLKKITKNGDIKNVFDTDINVKDISLNSYGEVFIDFTDRIVLEDNYIYGSVKIDIINKTVFGINKQDNMELLPKGYLKGEILQSLEDRFNFDQKIEEIFDINRNEYIIIGYKETTKNYSIISIPKFSTNDEYKVLAFLKEKPIKVIKNSELYSNKMSTSTILKFNLHINEDEFTEQANQNTYTINWNTLDYMDGIHKIKVLAQDEYGRSFSDEIEVLIRNFKIELNAIRKEDRALTFKIHVGELTFNIDNPKGLSVAKYVIYRSVSGNEFESIIDIDSSGLIDNQYTYIDKSISTGIVYKYKVIAYGDNGEVLSVSEEVTI